MILRYNILNFKNLLITLRFILNVKYFLNKIDMNNTIKYYNKIFIIVNLLCIITTDVNIY